MSLLALAKQTAADILEVAGGSSRRTSYSQFGEDVVLQSLLGDKIKNRSPGFFIDIGAFAPKTFSNTYALYRLGWRGINVDATPGSMRAFRVLRPRDVNLEAAISSTEGTLPFYRMGIRSVMNTMSREVADRYAQEHGLTIQTIEVPTYRLETILDRHLPENARLDLLSVDVEGLDLQVLTTNNWSKYRPTIVAVEDHGFDLSATSQSATFAFMRAQGYTLRAWVNPTQVWQRPEPRT